MVSSQRKASHERGASGILQAVVPVEVPQCAEAPQHLRDTIASD